MIKVLKSGLLATIQDFGRYGYVSFGVPTSGAMDMQSFKVANTILNNTINDAAIEIAYGNCEFLFTLAAEICISGADCSPKVDGENISMNRRVKVDENSVLTLNNTTNGVFSYLAVKGGIRTKKVLKSRSYYKNITGDYRLKKGDVLPIYSNEFLDAKTFTNVKPNFFFNNSNIIKCFRGPEFYLLSDKNKHEICNKVFSVSTNHNRMGYRLLETLGNKLEQILTSSVLPGTVQLTPSGELIILMRDAQVTGGYPRILQLKEDSIAQIAQKTTNDTFVFFVD